MLDHIETFKAECQSQFELKERSLLQSFDQKLSKLCAQFEERRLQKAQERSQTLKEELHRTKELEILQDASHLIYTKNKQLLDENKQLRSQLASREAEFYALMHKYLALKQDRTPSKPQTATTSPTPPSRLRHSSARSCKFYRCTTTRLAGGSSLNKWTR